MADIEVFNSDYTAEQIEDEIENGVPYIDSTTKHWMRWDIDEQEYVDTGIVAEAQTTGATWGTINGTLSNQTDLNTALAGKQDTLVSGTNIKTVGGQTLLGSTDIPISNRNLLDNPFFTVNQRGSSTYDNPSSTASYTVDRWVMRGGSCAINSDGSITLTKGDASTYNYFRFSVPYEKADFASLAGKTVTLSMDVVSSNIEGTGNCRFGLYNSSSPYAHSTPLVSISIVDDMSGIYSTQYTFYSMSSYGNDYFVVGVIFTDASQGDTITIRSVKLEVSSVSTLAYDTAPNYAEELAKCQRYFQRIGNKTSGRTSFASGQAESTTQIIFVLPLPVTMRTTPSVEITNAEYWTIISTGAVSGSIDTVTSVRNNVNSIQLVANVSDNTLIVGNPVLFRSAITGWIDLSADL